jgi:hypothetical protein
VTAPWWQGYAPAETWVRCGTADHVVRWTAGRLLTPDHDHLAGDREAAERTGARCACADLADVWAQHLDDLDVLVLAGRGRADPPVVPRPEGRGVDVTALAGAPAEMIAGRLGPHPSRAAVGATTYFTVRANASEPQPLDRLLAAGGRLDARLAATVAACWAAWLADGQARARAARPALAAAVGGWATVALREWLGVPRQAVEVEMVPAGEAAGLSRRGSTVVARLPFEWLVQVGLRDAAVVLDRFVVAVVDAAENRWTFETVDRTFTERREVTVAFT